MNNVEIADDFIKNFKEQFSNTKLDGRDKMIINMAITHACNILRNQEKKSE